MDTVDSTELAERAEVIEALTEEQQVEIKAEIAGKLNFKIGAWKTLS